MGSLLKVTERLRALLQAVFERMGYAEWVGLSTHDKKVKSAPYRELIKDTWARLKRSKPEMQSAS
jgi:chorismate mutase